MDAFCAEITGLPGPDQLTAWQVDTAVEVFGSHIESKLHELDKNNKPKYQLKDLLSDRKMTSSKVADISALFGMEVITVEALMQDEAYLEQVRSGKVKKPPGWVDPIDHPPSS